MENKYSYTKYELNMIDDQGKSIQKPTDRNRIAQVEIVKIFISNRFADRMYYKFTS